MERRTSRLARLAPLVGNDPTAFRDASIALVLSAITSLVAGLTLAVTTDTLEELPGLLLLVPAAIAVKGNIFGALGSRLGTSIHAGSFVFRSRPDSLVGQNASAALVLSFVVAIVLAVMAKAVAIAFDISPTISLADFVVISTVGGIIASVFVLAITLALAGGSVRFGWDLDNVVAPLVTATGDVVSLPSLVLAAELAGVDVLTPALAVALVVVATIALIWVMGSEFSITRALVIESLPILAIAGLLDLIAGITVEKRLDDFLEFPVLLVLLPGYLGTAGALGGILSSRLSTKLHLGLVEPRYLPRGPARHDISLIFVMSIPVFGILAFLAAGAGEAAGKASPGLWDLVAVSVLGGLGATVLVVVVAYYGTLAAVRFGLDPDTAGIPMVTSALDLFGAFTLILAVVLLGIT